MNEPFKHFSYDRNENYQVFASTQSKSKANSKLYEFAVLPGSKNPAAQQPFMPDDHSESVPPLPIPNRTVKRLSADDSADSRVKVGHRQAPYKKPPRSKEAGVLLLSENTRFL